MVSPLDFKPDLGGPLNLAMAGNPRYQPDPLKPVFGYDVLYTPAVRVEISTLLTRYEYGHISSPAMATLTPNMFKALLNIRTTKVDEREKQTKHDVKALTDLMKEILKPELRRFLHVPMTSYDTLATASVLAFKQAHQEVMWPAVCELIGLFADETEKYADQIQIGRTHGQHALPITAGFWFATILDRLLYCADRMREAETRLVGKISGAVGAKNAQVGMQYPPSFEKDVLAKLGLQPARISTQILPPEPMLDYLAAMEQFGQALAQYANDARQLMRTEIGEYVQPFDPDQTGSSTMAHKRNPYLWENVCGGGRKLLHALAQAKETGISEHQRDLTGSSLMRDFPETPAILMTMAGALLRKDKSGKAFLSRSRVDPTACLRNFEMSKYVVMAEPLYIALQDAGYKGDAHAVVNHFVVPVALEKRCSLSAALKDVGDRRLKPGLLRAWEKIPETVRELFDSPERYTGNASQQARYIAAQAREWLSEAA